MFKTTGSRFAVIILVVAYLGYQAYLGLFDAKLEQGTDLKGGSELNFRFKFEGVGAGERQDLLNEAIRIVQQRVDNFGLKDIEILPLGNDRFSLQVSAQDKAVVDSIKELVTVLGNLEFRITVEKDGSFAYDKYWRRFQEARKKGLDDAYVIRPGDLEPDDKSRAPNGLRWYDLSARAAGPQAEGGYNPSRLPEGGEPFVLCIVDTFDVGGEALDSVNYYRDTEGFSGGSYKVSFRVKKEWQSSMRALTETDDSRDKHMAIILNGEIDSAPVLQSTLSSNGEISGSFTEADAKKLAAVLQAGSLKEKPELISERTIAAELAGSSRDRGILSTLIAFCVVLGLMVYFYFGPGLLANVALLLNLLLLVGCLAWFEAVLTLPGIAGVVLTVGMAVDANILVFERIKEEKAKGRTVAQAVETGYDRALVTIIDANLTTLITAYFLFQIGSGPVRGFGITLAIGILISMFTALFVTRTIFSWLMSKGVMTEAKMNGEYHPPKINWMSKKKNAVTVSAVLMVAGLFLWEAVPPLKKYDLDFSEGSRLIARFADSVAKADVEKKIAEMASTNPEYSDVSVRVSAEGIGSAVAAEEGRVYEIRSQKISEEGEIEDFKNQLRASFAGSLVPGPFRSTLAEKEGRTEGVLTFVGEDVKEAWIREAFLAWAAQRNILRDPQVKAVEAGMKGAGSAFVVSFSDAISRERDIDLNVDKALKAFNADAYAAALADLKVKAAATESTEAQKKEYGERAAALEAAPLPADAAGLFALTDPLPSADRVDPFTARQHRDAAVQAIALSIIGIIVYVAFRFRSWAFGFAAVIALIHDVLVVLGLVALTNMTGIIDARLNLVTVAAFLTLIGYSINDTIVVFDRIRENRGSGRARLEEILNRSINQTFRRTIRTTVTTWIVVTILFALNIGSNSPLEGFAFILMMGVLVGTYSSIFIASPTLLFVPWLWEQCGSSVRSFFIKVLPFAAVCFAGFMVVEYRAGELSGDWSKVGFTDLVLSIPLGALLLFLWKFVAFVRLENPAEASANAS